MKKLQKAVLAALFAVMLALGAIGFAACADKNDTPKAEYTMTFMVGTMVYDSVTATEGSGYQTKEAPVRVNSVFDGWSQTENGAVEELPAKMPSENRTYYAIFSAQYTLSLNPGVGTIPDEQKIMPVKVGDDLYAKLSAVTPTLTDSDATFDGWYLRGTDKITEGAGVMMPGGNVEVVAKYSVAYTLNVYKEVGLNADEYPADPTTTVNGTALVGDRVADLPAYPGFRYDNDKDNTALTDALGKSSAQNVLSVYYEYIAYEAEFAVNLPSDVVYDGETKAITCGYDIAEEAPECGYTADGYRFQGWATTPDGDAVYYPGDEFSVDRTTIFYAKWVKGLTDLTRFSSDRVYIMNKIGEPTTTVAYLERVGLKDILGTYNATTHVFEFKNVYLDNGPTLLRGIADTTRNTYTYLNVDSTTVYTLLGSDDATKCTIALNDNGKAVYVDKDGDSVNGTYFADDDNSLLFVVDGETQFAFRLVVSDGDVACYEIRGEEYGVWYGIGQDGYITAEELIRLDGYGYATMNKYNASTGGFSAFGGVYGLTTGLEGAYDGDKGTEVLITFYNSSLNVRPSLYLLMTGDYASVNGAIKAEKVCLQRFSATLYAAPAEGETVDTATADKVVFTGYGVLDDGAVYTYKNEAGETVTVKGKYVYDSVFGTIAMTTADGERIIFEIGTSGEGDNAVSVFTLADVEECGRYNYVTGLPQGYYVMYFYSDNDAAIAFRFNMTDSFYGTGKSDYVMSILGKYELVLAGTEDKTGNVYEFSATPTVSMYNMLVNSYGASALGFFRFKFQFVYNNDGKPTSISVVKPSDFMQGATFEYGEVKYELDGYGSAVGDDSKLKYFMDYSIGIERLVVEIPDVGNVVFFDIDGDGTFTEIVRSYGIANGDKSIVLLTLKDDTAALCLMVQSGLSYAFYTFSYGEIVWNNEQHTIGRYIADEEYDFGDVYNALEITYSEFMFSIVSKTTTNDKGETNTTYTLYMFEVNNAQANDNGKYVITNANGDELSLDVTNMSAKYVIKGTNGEADTTYIGSFSYDGYIRFVYANSQVISFNIVEGTPVTFEVIGTEAGTFLDSGDFVSYLVLSGKKSGGKDDVYSGTYYVYDEQANDYNVYQGSYRKSAYGVDGFDFTYAVDGGAQSFTFMTGRNNAGLQLFVKYVPTISYNVYAQTISNFGNPTKVAELKGGGYSDYYYMNSPISGKAGDFEKYNDENDIYVFTFSDGTQYYFKKIDSQNMMRLDGTYVPDTDGVFALSEDIELTIPGTPATMETPAIPEHTATISAVKLTGYAIAEMTYDYNGEQKTVQAIYGQTSSGTIAMVDANGNLLAILRLMVRTNQDGSKTYFAQVCDLEYNNVFVSDELSLVSLNGFNSAVYVDSYGRIHSGTYTKDENGVVCISYIDTYYYRVVYVYLTVNTETGKFTIVPAPSTDAQLAA